MDLKNKKVLLVGLGILGGGLATAQYLLSKGAILTVTDLRERDELKDVIKKLPNGIDYIFGKNPDRELKDADLIILNPAIPARSELVKKIKNLGKEYYSDYTFFLKKIGEKDSSTKIIGVTGTRGKTTVSTWINALIPNSVLGGNVPERSLYKLIDKKAPVYVLELSSFQLEHIKKNDISPNIAIITNIYVDHLNRYETYKRYSDIKKKIYQNQGPNDYLILNNNEESTKEIEQDRPKSNILYISTKELPSGKNGIYTNNNLLYQRTSNGTKEIGKLPELARHEKTNLMFAALGANLYGISWKEIIGKIRNLENPLYREQLIYNKSGIKVINDSAGTSPEAVMAAIDKFGKDNLYLITGGTDKELDYEGLAKSISGNISPERLYLLSGTGTQKLKESLSHKYLADERVREFDDLEQIVATVAKEIVKGVLVFSPGASSFEKFKNEFDRGKKFDSYVKKYFS